MGKVSCTQPYRRLRAMNIMVYLVRIGRPTNAMLMRFRT